MSCAHLRTRSVSASESIGSSQEIGELRHTSAFESLGKFIDCSGCSAISRGLPPNLVLHDFWREISEIEQKVVGMNHIDLKWLGRLGREIGEVERDDGGGAPSCRSSEHVAILRVAGHRCDELHIASHGGIRKRSLHLVDPVCSSLSHNNLGKISLKLFEDVVAPQRAIQLTLGQTKNGVTQMRRVQHTGVEDDGAEQ